MFRLLVVLGLSLALNQTRLIQPPTIIRPELSTAAELLAVFPPVENKHIGQIRPIQEGA
jgi:hypothetical protein